jgi:hypothetical protein
VYSASAMKRSNPIQPPASPRIVPECNGLGAWAARCLAFARAGCRAVVKLGDNFERARSVNLLRSPIDPDDVARTAVFLAENDSITGITVAVDKGQHLVPLERDIMFVAEQLAPPPPVNP